MELFYITKLYYWLYIRLWTKVLLYRIY